MVLFYLPLCIFLDNLFVKMSLDLVKQVAKLVIKMKL